MNKVRGSKNAVNISMEKLTLIIVVLLILSSCSLIKRKGQWGKKALWPIRGSNIWDAAKKNASSPHVWAPLIGATTTHWAGWDHKISNWATTESDLYKDQDAADNWSNHFNNILKYEVYATTLITPSMNEDGNFGVYFWHKAKGALVISISHTTASSTHDWLAETTDRRRPNKNDHRSFPSGHATNAGTRDVINSKNLNYIDMNDDLRSGIKTVNTTMAFGVLWARLEGNRHFPSDVLAGYALGSFVSGFIYDSFMNLDKNESFVFAPMGGGKYTAQYVYAF